MPLHPKIREALQAAEGQPPLETCSIAEARAQAKAAYAPTVPVPVGAVKDFVLPGGNGGIRARLYTPAGTGPFPLLVFFHGSGFVLLDLDTHDAICRRLCDGAACMVVSVDYRLAPEHRFPAAPDDCLAATRWTVEHALAFGGDPARIAVAGDSAGGALAAVTALRIRDEGGPRLCGQILFYPVTDFPEPLRSTHEAFATGYGLTLNLLRWFWSQYLTDSSLAGDPRASPIRAHSLADLPSALILTAEYDVLRDEGERYADRLRDAGVDTQLQRCEGMNHGFLKFAGIIHEASARLDQASAWLRRIYSTAR